MRTRYWLILVLIISPIFAKCTGMFVPSVEGYVLNACNEEPIVKADVSIRIFSYPYAPFLPHTNSVTLREARIYTDENGNYKIPFNIGAPKGLIHVGVYSNVFAKKEGYSISLLAHEQYTSYMIPEKDKNYERMQEIWRNTNGGIRYKPKTREAVANNRYLNFIKYAEGYQEAERIAKTPRELAFLDYFCLRVRQTYASFTEADHASMDSEWKFDNEYRKIHRLPELPFNKCTSHEVLADTPKMFLSAEQVKMLFLRPACEDVSNVLKPKMHSPHDGWSDMHNKSTQPTPKSGAAGF